MSMTSRLTMRSKPSGKIKNAVQKIPQSVHSFFHRHNHRHANDSYSAKKQYEVFNSEYYTPYTSNKTVRRVKDAVKASVCLCLSTSLT